MVIRPKPTSEEGGLQSIPSREDVRLKRDASREHAQITRAVAITKHLDPFTSMQPELRDPSAKRIFHYSMFLPTPPIT